MIMRFIDKNFFTAFCICTLLAITFAVYDSVQKTDEVQQALSAADKDVRGGKCVMIQKEGQEVIYAYCSKIP